MEERAFATIAKDTVKMMAESVGITNVLDEAAALLGEDVNYHLREVVMKSTSFMKNAKRRRLCPEDFNQALRDLNVQPVFGHGSVTDISPFRQTREGELHFIEENDINFSSTVRNSYVPKHLGETSIKAQWMALEGVNKFSSSSHSAHLQHTSKNIKKESSSEVMAFYSCITKALVGSRPVLVKPTINVFQWALANLSENRRVQASLSYFVNFVANGVKVVSHDVTKLTMLMKTVASLLKNKTIYLEMQPYLRLMVQAVETCLLEPLASYMSQQSIDQWMLRHLAAKVLADIVRKWSTPVNRLRSTVTSKLSESLQDLGRPLCSHFGAVLGLTALGSAEVEAVLVPQLPQLLPHLQASASSSVPPSSSTPSSQIDAMRVLEAVQLAMEKLLRTYMDSDDLRDPDNNRRSNCNNNERRPPTHRAGVDAAPVRGRGQEIVGLYRQLSDCLGDALSARLPTMELDRVFRRHPSCPLVSLADEDSKRSGDELLADLMRQVRQEQEAEERRKWLLQQQRKQQQQQQQQQQYQQQQKLSSVLFPAQHQDLDSELRELMAAAASSSSHPADLPLPGQEAGFQEQLAISSTISDPSKGTLKLKIKRHPPGQGSPSLTRPSGKGQADTPDSPQQSRDAARDHRLKRKRKLQQLQVGKSPWEQGSGDLEGLSDLEDSMNHPLLGQVPRAYSPGGESSGSDSTIYKKGKLMLKLKVPSRDSPSE